MKKHLRIALLLSALPLVGCASSSILEGDSYSFPPFSYSNEEPIPAETYDFSNEDNMALDGKYKEQYGESVYRLYHKNDETSKCYSDLYLYYGKRGVHVYVAVKDNIINYVSQKAVYYNSSVEIFLNDISKNYIDNASVQWRVAAGGKATKLCGVRYRSTWTVSQFDGSFATYVDGELNTDNANGYGVEVFTPYYELGIKDEDIANLKGLNVYLAMNRVATTSTDQNLTFRQRTAKTLAFQATPTSWVPVYRKDDNSGENGFPKSEFYGRSHSIDTSLGFRFEKDDDGKERGYLDKSVALSYAMVKEGYDPLHYYYECRIKDIQGSSTARFGLFTYLSGNRFTLYLEKGNKARAGLVQRDAANSAWNWSVGEGQCYINDFDKDKDLNFLSKEGTKLALYRNEDTYAFFVNDALYYATRDVTLGENVYSPEKVVTLNHALSELEGLYQDAYIGLYSYSAKAEFTDYAVYSGEEADSCLATLMNK